MGHSCANGAACVDQVGSYTCTCVTGYEGALCDTGGCIMVRLVSVKYVLYVDTLSYNV